MAAGPVASLKSEVPGAKEAAAKTPAAKETAHVTTLSATRVLSLVAFALVAVIAVKVDFTSTVGIVFLLIELLLGVISIVAWARIPA